MNHPFGLNLSDLAAINLDFEEHLTDEEAAKVQGGSGTEIATTLALGEEGGDLTTLALGEEGGEDGEIVCISAPCPGSETGGTPYPDPQPIPPKPPVLTTRINCEQGDEPVYTKARYGLEAGGWTINW